jgi:hypothetical protein
MDHTPTTPAWQQDIFKVLKEGNVRQIAYLQTKCVWINSGAVTGNPFVMR